MLHSGRSPARARDRVAATIASLLAVVLSLVFVLRSTSDFDLLQLPADQGPVGAAVESGEFDSLPFGKLLEETAAEEAEEKSESKDAEVAALSSVDLDALALAGRMVVVWERPSPHRARALLGVIGARGPPVG